MYLTFSPYIYGFKVSVYVDSCLTVTVSTICQSRTTRSLCRNIPTRDAVTVQGYDWSDYRNRVFPRLKGHSFLTVARSSD